MNIIVWKQYESFFVIITNDKCWISFLSNIWAWQLKSLFVKKIKMQFNFAMTISFVIYIIVKSFKIEKRRRNDFLNYLQLNNVTCFNSKNKQTQKKKRFNLWALETVYFHFSNSDMLFISIHFIVYFSWNALRYIFTEKHHRNLITIYKMTTYLRKVKRIWNHIADEDDNIRLHLNANIIKNSQRLCLWTRQDWNFVENKRKKMFSMI